MKKQFKLSIPTTLIISSFILGAFYYAGVISKQKSEERILEMQINEQSKKEEEIATKKITCASEAVTLAKEQYRVFCTPTNYCNYTEGFYSIVQYNNAYSHCLQSVGIE